MAPLRVRVGADGRGEVLGPGRSWAFEVELGARTAVLVDAGGTTTVRPPTWRERSSLAQFAPLGDAFLVRSLARACVTRSTAMPAGAAAEGGPGDDVIVAIAAWLEDPFASLALPDDADGLAAITLDLCRRTGLRPAEIGNLPAYEVAELWTAPGAGDGASAGRAEPLAADERWTDAPDGTSRIVIVDDPLPDGPEEARTEGGVGRGAPDVPEDPALGPADDRTEAALAPGGVAFNDVAPSAPDRTAARRIAPEVASGAAHRTPARARLRVRRVAADPPTLGGGRPTPADLAPAARRLDVAASEPEAAGHRIWASSLGASAGTGAAGIETPVASAAAAPPPGRSAAASSVDTREPSVGSVVLKTRDPMLAAARRPSAAAGPMPDPLAHMVSHAAAPLTERDWDDESSPAGALGPGAGDALLAQLADELERAAVLLGIGEEG